MRSSLKEALERQERDRNGGAGHHPSGIPVELVLKISDQPVDLVKALMAFGLDLHEAHDIVDRLASGEKVATTLYLTAEGESPFALSRFGVMVGAPQPVDAASIPVDVLNAIEAWRLSEPERPTRDEAIGIILRRGLAAA
jgi:hypothetical protein